MLYFGCDPEVFSTIVDDNKEYVISPALMEKFCGIKPVYVDRHYKHPVYIKNEQENFSWMMDGCAWELTLLKPFSDLHEMFQTIQKSLEVLGNYLSGLKFQGMDVNLFKKPVVNIYPGMYLEYLDELPIYQGFIFGCDPDFDAGDKEYNCKTLDVQTHPYRYGGGHIHFSLKNTILTENINPNVKLTAIFLGNFCTSKTLFPAEDLQRVLTYGKPLRFRPQHYGKSGYHGIEYRSPSNSWLSLNEEDFADLFKQIRKVIKLIYNPAVGEKIVKEFLSDTEKAITNADINLAKSILERIENV